jgi:hypothetical protein
VIRGEFAKPGQTDWAVLCSINRVSSILVYWNGSETNPAELGKGEDRGLLQTVSEQRVGYSRQITAVGSQWILRYHSYHGGPTPPPIDHLGIEDSFVGKASVILYYFAGQWLRLQGAD